MNDRIKLAEAMGWTRSPNLIDPQVWHPPGESVDEAGWWFEYMLPDPFTDANDDYAVLEWILSDGSVWPKVSDELTTVFIDRDEYHELHVTAYRIGDYARAALKVIAGGIDSE